MSDHGVVEGERDSAGRSRYDARSIERKWRERWDSSGLYHTDLDRRDGRPKFYNLMEFPYPSAEGLHIGHVYTYGGADTNGRFQRMRGYNVFEPMGFDAFGIHTENYALKVDVNPMQLTAQTTRRFREDQLGKIGAMFDWGHTVDTSRPEYYRWTQWLFLRLYHAGLAVRKEAPVNWCPSCLTVLANEQVLDGRCERCDSEVTQRELTQWFFKITDYAERLLGNLEQLDWPDESKRRQSNWIGKSVGAELMFPVVASDDRIPVFTTRPDTVFGATYVVLAPEHKLVEKLVTADRRAAVSAYVAQARRSTEIERTNLEREKTGVFTGAYAVNPASGAHIPIWVADYVLAQYGTGAIMAVPAHDARDFEFARQFALPIFHVVARPEGDAEDAYTGAGVLVASGQFTGLDSEVAAEVLEPGLAIDPGATRRLVELGMEVKRAVEDTIDVIHPTEPKLRGVYGTILTGPPQRLDAHGRNVTIFADGQLDRSPCGTGTAARVAALFARGELATGQSYVHESIIGSCFTGRVIGETAVGQFTAVIPEITGRGFITGLQQFVLDPEDQVGQGFLVR